MYNSTVCSPFCRDVGRQDIIYNSTSLTWACCGEQPDGSVNCDEPTVDERFFAPHPASLSTTFSLGSTIQTAATPSIRTTTTNSLSPSSTLVQTQNPSSATSTVSGSQAPTTSKSSRSSGIKIGIGIVAGIAGITAFGVLIFCMRKNKKQNTRGMRLRQSHDKVKVEETNLTNDEAHMNQAHTSEEIYPAEIGGNERYEIYSVASEQRTNTMAHELPAQNV